MLPLGPIPDAAGRDVILSGRDANAVAAYCHEMGSRLGCPQYMRYVFGLPVDKALSAGYLMTQRALRETVPHACAREIARTARELIMRLHGEHSQGRVVLDLFGGIGQTAYSYAIAGYRVQSVDNDTTTVNVATSNMNVAGLAGVVTCALADGPDTLSSAVKNGDRYSVVYLDPPWRGNYKYDLGQAFRLDDLGVDVQSLLRLALDSAPLVVLSLPHNALSTQIREVASQLGAGVLVQYQYVSDFPAIFSQAPAYFFRSGAAAAPVPDYQEERQRLTLDGQRLD
jgi:predicted RNA methylase